LRIAIPNKGRLRQPVLDFLSASGIKPLLSDERALIVPTNWEVVQLVMVRTEDVPNLVEAGATDLGITGLDYVLESKAKVDELIKLDIGTAKIVLAVPSNWEVNHPSEIKREIRIATKYHNIASSYVQRTGLRAKIVKISGAAEVIPSLGAADAIIDVASTGTTLKLHGLKVIDEIMQSYAVVIGNRNFHQHKELVLTMMQGALQARRKKMVFMNVKSKNLDRVISCIPAMLAPAISKLSGKDAWEVITVVDEQILPKVIADAKLAGAQDIVVVGLEKVIR